MRAVVLLGIIGGCSVAPLSLEGKQCPCIDGYVCDMLTNRCLPTNDGGGIIDTAAATQCLPAGNETELYRYTGTYDWTTDGGNWTGNATEIHQASAAAQNAFTYKMQTNLSGAISYRVIASMRQILNGSGTPSFGIVLRAQQGASPRYSCDFSAKARELRLVHHNGGSETILGAAAINPAATLPTAFTMEAAVTGSTLACCIRELPDARLLNIPDPAMSLDSGFPGLTTTRMEAAFGSFVVFQR